MIRSVFSCAVALSVCSATALGGDLNPPPGPVTTTFKTLDQIGPSTPINNLPGSGLALHQITEPGAYHLTGNLISPGAGMYAIRCTSDNVTIDMRGFSILSNGEETFPAVLLNTACVLRNGTIDNWQARGVRALSTAVIEDVIFDFVRGGAAIDGARGLAIRRCSFRNCDPLVIDSNTLIRDVVMRDMAEAIVSPDADGVTIIDTQIDGQNTSGTDSVIVLGDDAKLANVTVSNEGNSGLTAGDNTSVIACTFSSKGTASNPGLSLNNNAIVKDCSISLYGGFGIEIRFGAVVRDNAIYNNGGGISCQVSGQISGNSVYANDGDGIDVSNGAVITDNLVRNNSGDGVAAGTDCLITNNQFVSNPVELGSRNTFDQNASTLVNTSLTVTGTDNRVTRNTLGGSINGDPFSNYIAPSTTSVSGVTPGPWWNIEL